MTNNENLTESDEPEFPWEDILASIHRKKSRETGENEGEIRKRLQGTIAPCRKCGKTFENMDVFYFKSPDSTWEDMCGRAGWMVICVDCKKQLWFEIGMLN